MTARDGVWWSSNTNQDFCDLPDVLPAGQQVGEQPGIWRKPPPDLPRDRIARLALDLEALSEADKRLERLADLVAEHSRTIVRLARGEEIIRLARELRQAAEDERARR